jgi:hypothetical protein
LYLFVKGRATPTHAPEPRRLPPMT